MYFLQRIVGKAKLRGLGHPPHLPEVGLDATYFRNVLAGRNGVQDDLLAFLYAKPTLLENFSIS